jgi:hypothetical protein
MRVNETRSQEGKRNESRPREYIHTHMTVHRGRKQDESERDQVGGNKVQSFECEENDRRVGCGGERNPRSKSDGYNKMKPSYT